MATSAPVTVTANLNFNPASLNAAGKQVQSAFGNINLPTKAANAFNNSLGRITGQASEFDKSINAATARVFAFGAAVSIINGLSTAFKALVSSTIEVEKRLTEIGSILGGTTEQLGQFKNAIFDVAKNTGQTFSTVADAASELARQGLSAEETVKRLNAALILTRVSGLDAEGSVNALTAAINGFTSAGLTAEQIVNKLIAVDTAFAVSAKDLAEAFSRAGSTAEDAGVSFDELLGLVTSVQQTTARGGAVIGNAFKSIFSRLSRGTVIEDLKALGVQIDSSQTGVQKLQALSDALAKISDPTQANAIKELAGGVYQINVVSAALKDLSSETSIFARASQTAGEASNEAFEKNAQLNQTLAAQINKLVQGLTELGSKIGELTIAPVIENLLTGANKLLDILNKVFDPEEGNKLIQGFFKGVGAFIAGPGLVLVSAAFFKLFQVVAKFAKEGISDLFKIGSEQERIKNIEGGIVALLQQDANLRATLLSSSTSQAQKEQAVINSIKQQNALLAQQQALVNSIAAAAAQAGVGGFSPSGGFSKRKGKGMFAAGFQAEEAEAMLFQAEEKKAMGLGAGSGVKAEYGKGTINGKEFIKNNKEIEITNFAGGRDSAVIPLYANGFVPNYAKTNVDILEQIIKNFQLRKNKPGNNSLTYTDKQNAFAKKVAEEEGITAKSVLDKGPGTILSNIKKKQESKLNQQEKLKEEQEKRLTIKSIHTKDYPFLIPNGGSVGALLDKQLGTASSLGTKYPYFLEQKGIIPFSFPNISSKKIDSVDDPYDTKLEEKITKEIASASFSFAKLLDPPSKNSSTLSDINDRLNDQDGAKGAIISAVGAAFEAAVSSALNIDSAGKSTGGANFDVPSSTGSETKTALKKLFNIGSFDAAEFKSSGSAGNIDSYIGKIIKAKNLGFKQLDTKTKATKTPNRASGFIPNFNSLNKGIPVNKIRAHFDDMGNPVAVTNTRDEPNGLKDAIGRERKGIGMAARGFVPNYANDSSRGSGSILQTIVLLGGLNTVLGAAGGYFSTLSEDVQEEIKTRDELLQKLEEESQKEKPDVGKVDDLRKAIEATNSSIEPAVEQAKKMEGYFSQLNTILNLAAIASEAGNMFGGKGKGNVGGVAGAPQTGGLAGAPQTKSMATKSSLGSAGNFGTQIGNTMIPNAAKIPPTIGPSIGKSLTPAVTKGLGSVGPAIKSFGPKILGSFKGLGPLLGRGVGAILGGPLGIAATLAPVVGNFLGKIAGEYSGEAAALKASKPLDDARTVWIQANGEARKIKRELEKLDKSIKEVENKIANGGEKSLVRSLTNTGELSRESFNKYAAGGSEAQRDRLNTYSEGLMDVNNLIRSQKARGPQTIEEQTAASKAAIEESSLLRNKGLQKDSQINQQEFSRELGKTLSGSSLLGEVKNATSGEQQDISKSLTKIEALQKQAQTLDPTSTNAKDFEAKQAKVQTELLAAYSSLEFNLNRVGKTDEEKSANKDFIAALKANANNLFAGQTKINNEAIKNEYASRRESLKAEQDILNKFIDNWNASFSQNLTSFEASLSNINNFDTGATISSLGEANFNKGALSNIRDPEERRAALQGRIGAVQQITGQAESLGLTSLLSPDQLTKFKSNLFTQSTLGSGVSAVQQNLLSPAASKINEKILGKQVTNAEGKVETVGGLQGDSKKAVEQALSTPIMDALNKLKEIGKAEGSTGGNILARDIERTQYQLKQSGGGSIEQFTKILSADLSRYGLKEESKIAGQMVQAETLASANQLTDVGLGQNLVKAQDDLSARTEKLASVFGTLVDSVEVDKIAELPKVTETIVTSITNLNKELEALKEAANKVHGSLVTAAKAAETAATNLGNIKGAPLTGKPVEVPPAPAQPQPTGPTKK
jgi:TP901 family phage tail tape measure protein